MGEFPKGKSCFPPILNENIDLVFQRFFHGLRNSEPSQISERDERRKQRRPQESLRRTPDKVFHLLIIKIYFHNTEKAFPSGKMLFVVSIKTKFDEWSKRVSFNFDWIIPIKFIFSPFGFLFDCSNLEGCDFSA